MARLADISAEYCHLYLRDLDRPAADRDQFLDAHLGVAKEWLTPILERSDGLSVSKVIMIDDYFSDDDELVANAHDWILEACSRHSLTPDRIVLESEIAASVEQLTPEILFDPADGDGSVQQQFRSGEQNWLSNGSPPRSNQHEVASLDRAGGRHPLHLDVQLFTPNAEVKKYSCALLAAWWQLVRLGAAAGSEDLGSPTDPEQSLPLAGKRTLSILDSRFIEVEHAVRTILNRVQMPEEWRRRMQVGRDLPESDAHLDRIDYVFTSVRS